jgi:hypothetical protein
MKICILLLMLISCVFPAHTAPTVVFENASPKILDRAITIAKDEFTPTRLKDLARRFVEVEGRHFVLARLTIGIDAADVGRAFALVRAEATYESSLENIRTAGLPEAPLARVVAFNGAAILWTREGRTIVTEHLVGEADAIALREGAVTLELLHFNVLQNRAPVAPNDQYGLAVFLKAVPALSISACTAVAKRLRELTSVGWVSLYAREDIWFLDNDEYPDVLPFAKHIDVPTKGQFERAPHVTCIDNWRGAIKCSGWSFAP